MTGHVGNHTHIPGIDTHAERSSRENRPQDTKGIINSSGFQPGDVTSLSCPVSICLTLCLTCTQVQLTEWDK